MGHTLTQYSTDGFWHQFNDKKIYHSHHRIEGIGKVSLLFSNDDELLCVFHKGRISKPLKNVNTEQNQAKGETLFTKLINNEDLKLVTIGTNFQNSVWKELLKIPNGSTVTYHDIAKRIKRPKAYRAVANAVGANPISVTIPCHRVLRTGGGIGGFGWGLPAKRVLLKREGITIQE